MKKYFPLLALALGLIVVGGCATRDYSTKNTSDQPWDRPLPEDRPGFKTPAGEPGNPANPGNPKP